jgi:type II secretory pathway pseudopilin PulG
MNRMREQGGFGLIEVIVSAAVLALASLGVLAGIEGAQSSSGREKARSIAATLAEQDQERLRSLQFDTLDSYTDSPPPPTQVIADGVAYTITSTTAWRTDDPSGADKCTSSSSNAKYLQLTSVVTSKTVGTKTAPVRMDSLESPSVRYSANHGDLGVKVVDRNGTGVPNIAVSIAGPESASLPTDSTGCALFSNITVGSYDANLNTPGYVDHWGNTATQLPDLQVAAGSVTVKSIAYDQAGSVVATIKTYPPSATSTTYTMSSGAPTLTAANGTEVGLLRTYPTSTPGTVGLSSITADKLFPFTNAYAFFSGSCGYDNPSTYDTPTSTPPFAYWSATPAFAGQLIAQPNQSLAVTAMQPPLLVNFKTNAKGQTVTAGQETVVATPVKPSGESCNDQKITDLTTKNWPTSQGAPNVNSPNANGWVGRGSPQTVNGKQVYDAGVPFGSYQLCFQDTSKGGSTPWHYTWGGTYDNTKPYPGTTGTTSNINAPLVINATSGWVSGACP